MFRFPVSFRFLQGKKTSQDQWKPGKNGCQQDKALLILDPIYPFIKKDGKHKYETLA